MILNKKTLWAHEFKEKTTHVFEDKENAIKRVNKECDNLTLSDNMSLTEIKISCFRTGISKIVIHDKNDEKIEVSSSPYDDKKFRAFHDNKDANICAKQLLLGNITADTLNSLKEQQMIMCCTVFNGRFVYNRKIKYKQNSSVINESETEDKKAIIVFSDLEEFNRYKTHIDNKEDGDKIKYDIQPYLIDVPTIFSIAQKNKCTIFINPFGGKQGFFVSEELIKILLQSWAGN